MSPFPYLTDFFFLVSLLFPIRGLNILDHEAERIFINRAVDCTLKVRITLMTHRHSLNHPNGSLELYYFLQVKFKYCPVARWMTPRTAAKLNYQLTCRGSPNYWALPSEADKLDYEVNPSSLFITPLTSVKSQSDLEDACRLNLERL